MVKIKEQLLWTSMKIKNDKLKVKVKSVKNRNCKVYYGIDSTSSGWVSVGRDIFL